MNRQEYAERFGRWIKDNEIVFDADDREKGWEAINFIGVNLYNAGIRFHLEFAEGQKSPHLIVDNIHFLEDLSKEELAAYKKLFIKKYTPKGYLNIIDFQLCKKHRVAEVGKKHYRYGTIKKILSKFNQDKENFLEEDILIESKSRTTQERKRDVKITSGITNKIVQKISIIDLAERYGLKVRGNKAICPFHKDSNPSLNLDDSRGLFYCFGCGAGGNIIDFVYLLRKNKLGEIKNV